MNLLTQDLKVVSVERVGVAPIRGHSLVVYEVIDNVPQFVAVVDEGKELTQDNNFFKRTFIKKNYISYAVRNRPSLDYSFPYRFRHKSTAHDFDLSFSLRYRVYDYRTIVDRLSSDPIKKIKTNITDRIGSRVSMSEWNNIAEQNIRDNCRELMRAMIKEEWENLRDDALTYGIELIDLSCEFCFTEEDDRIYLNIISNEVEAKKIDYCKKVILSYIGDDAKSKSIEKINTLLNNKHDIMQGVFGLEHGLKIETLNHEQKADKTQGLEHEQNQMPAVSLPSFDNIIGDIQDCVAPEINAPVLTDTVHKSRLGGNPFDKAISQTPASSPQVQGLGVSQVVNKNNEFIECTVFAPEVICLSESFLVQVYINHSRDRDIVKSESKEFDKSSSIRGACSLDDILALGDRISLHLTIPGVVVDDPISQFIWRNNRHGVQFSAHLPSHIKNNTLIGTVLVSANEIPVGCIKFLLNVSPKIIKKDKNLSKLDHSALKFSRAFISYASVDRKEVLKRVQVLKAFGIEYFQDLINLEAGQEYERVIFKQIEDADAFLLFWSTAARRSMWVAKEIDYMLEQQTRNKSGLPTVIPIILEGPPPPPPPPRLAHMHFNDYLLYLA